MWCVLDMVLFCYQNLMLTYPFYILRCDAVPEVLVELEVPMSMPLLEKGLGR